MTSIFRDLILAAALFFGFIGCTSSSSSSSAPSASTTFGSKGYIGFGSTGLTGAADDLEADQVGYHGLAVDSQGRIVAVVSSYNIDRGRELGLVRYTATGELDTTFGGGDGYITGGTTGAAGATGSANVDDNPNALQIDSQGRIVVVGRSVNGSGGIDLAIWRFNSDGTPDTSFGSGTGHVVSTGAAGGALDAGVDFRIDSQGRFIIGGFSKNAGAGIEAAVWRYTSAGVLDTSFGGGNGFVVSGTTGASGATGAQEGEIPSTLIIDSQDRIVLVGMSKATGWQLALWRFNANGTIDNTFGTSGSVASGTTGAYGGTGVHQMDNGLDAKIDSLGRIIIVGQSTDNSYASNAVIWRYTSAGALDTSFGGGNGYVILSTEQSTAYSLQIDSNGKLIIAGQGDNGEGGVAPYVWRYNSDGTLDTTFGSNTGFVFLTTGVGGNTGALEFDSCNVLVLDSSGRYLTAGFTTNASFGGELALWRFLPTGNLDK